MNLYNVIHVCRFREDMPCEKDPVVARRDGFRGLRDSGWRHPGEISKAKRFERVEVVVWLMWKYSQGGKDPVG